MAGELTSEHDLVILGGGPAGEHALGRACRAGLDTVLVEHELVGGECSYWGCIPSKTLLRPGRALAAARAVPGAAAAAAGAIDAPAALARRDEMVAGFDDAGQVDWVAKAGGTLVRGHGRLAGERRVVVDGDPVRTLIARRAVVVATGSSSFRPPVPGLDATPHWDNRDGTAARAVPRRLAVLGGGAVGVELAQAWRRLGCDAVTVIEASPRLVASAEPFASAQLERALRADGIDVRTGVAATAVARQPADGPVTVSLASGDEVVADELLVAVGRRPRTADIGLETLGLDPGRPLEVDERLRVREVPGAWLYAVGDVNGIALLTHMAKYQARVAVDTVLGLEARALAHDGAIPSIVFTDPEVASVGLTEDAARSKGIAVRVVSTPSDAVAGSSIHGTDATGSCQLVLDDATGTIVGATFVGRDLGELLHGATIAVSAQVPIDRLRHAVPTFPSTSELWLELVEAAIAGAPPR